MFLEHKKIPLFIYLLYWIHLNENQRLNGIFEHINVLYGYAGLKGAMPIKGACLDCTDSDLVDVISYIYNYNNLLIHHWMF